MNKDRLFFGISCPTTLWIRIGTGDAFLEIMFFERER
jgi:hypothetical protein